MGDNTVGGADNSSRLVDVPQNKGRSADPKSAELLKKKLTEIAQARANLAKTTVAAKPPQQPPLRPTQAGGADTGTARGVRADSLLFRPGSTDSTSRAFIGAAHDAGQNRGPNPAPQTQVSGPAPAPQSDLRTGPGPTRAGQDAGSFSMSCLSGGRGGTHRVTVNTGLKFAERAPQTFDTQEAATAHARNFNNGYGAAVVAEGGRFSVYRLEGTGWTERNFNLANAEAQKPHNSVEIKGATPM